MTTEDLKMFHDEDHYVIAKDAEDARQIMREFQDLDGPCTGDGAPEPFREMKPEKSLSMHMDDGTGTTKQTVAEWISSKGRGYLASVNY